MSNLWFNPHGVDLSVLATIITANDPRPLKEQIHEGYAHGGGYHPCKGFTLDFENLALRYPGDPPLRPLATTTINNERFVLFESDFCAIIQPDNAYDIIRMD